MSGQGLNVSERMLRTNRASERTSGNTFIYKVRSSETQVKLKLHFAWRRGKRLFNDCFHCGLGERQGQWDKIINWWCSDISHCQAQSVTYTSLGGDQKSVGTSLLFTHHLTFPQGHPATPNPRGPISKSALPTLTNVSSGKTSQVSSPRNRNCF